MKRRVLNWNMDYVKVHRYESVLWHQPVLAWVIRELVLVGIRKGKKTFSLESG